MPYVGGSCAETILDESTGGHKRRYAGGVTVDLDEF